MCAQQGAATMLNHDFTEYCKNLREHDQCEYFTNAHKLSVSGKAVLEQLQKQSPMSAEHVVASCSNEKLCPYEMSLKIAKQATVIITDYFYLFSPVIREKFMSKIDKQLEASIIIVDEGHNLPDRIRNLLSQTLSTVTLSFAQKEAASHGFEPLLQPLAVLGNTLAALSRGVKEERALEKNDLMKPLLDLMPYADLLEALESGAVIVTKEQKRSALGTVAEFLNAWTGTDEGYARILSKKRTPRGETLQLSYQCLDPSLVTTPVIEQSYWTLLMSGTLNPPDMYRDLLGFPINAETQEYGSPFAAKNRLTIVIPKTTTKFTARSEQQYADTAKILIDLINNVPGNCAIFFPSYQLRDHVYKYLETECARTMFREDPSLTKDDRVEMIERFKSYKDAGAVLLGVASGSFGEGIDLPGDYLKCVIVVGLPLSKPDLQTQELIKYYEDKFGRGWDYGYVLPAFTKTLQNAGRCIRSETDRGAMIFLDERYAWPQYLRCFPADWDVQVTTEYAYLLNDFYGKK